MVILHSSFFLLRFPGGTVATVGFPDIGLQGFAPKLAGLNAKAQRCQDCKE